MKAAVIANSIAVKRCAADWRRIADYTKNGQFSSCDVRMTDSGGQATRLTREVVHSGCEMVVAVGGDGTVNEVLNGLFENGAVLNQDLVLGVIPLGSGCDLVRSLGIPRKTSDAIKMLEGNGDRKIDVGRVDFTNL